MPIRYGMRAQRPLLYCGIGKFCFLALCKSEILRRDVTWPTAELEELGQLLCRYFRIIVSVSFVPSNFWFYLYIRAGYRSLWWPIDSPEPSF